MIITTKSLLSALQTCGKAIGTSIIVPACENYQFTISGDKLTIAATNMKFHISTVVDIQDGNDLCVLINAALLNELIRGLPEQPVTFAFGKDQVIITYNETGKTTLPTEDGKDFPKPVTPKTKQTLVVNSDVIKQGFARTVWAIASDRADAPHLECLNVVLATGLISFTASDGFQLATYSFEAPHKAKANILIPDNCIGAFDLPDNTEIAIIIGDASLSMQYGDTTIISTLFDGKFPDISGVIGDGNKKATVNKQELLSVLNRVRPFASKTIKQLRLSFGDNLRIRAENIDFGHEAEEYISIDYSGEPIEIGVPVDKFIAGVKNMGEEIFMSLLEPKRPIVMRDIDSDTKDNLTLIVPSILK